MAYVPAQRTFAATSAPNAACREPAANGVASPDVADAMPSPLRLHWPADYPAVERTSSSYHYPATEGDPSRPSAALPDAGRVKATILPDGDAHYDSPTPPRRGG